MHEHLCWKVTENREQQNLEQFLCSRIKGLGRKRYDFFSSKGLILVNGQAHNTSYIPQIGDEIRLMSPYRPRPMIEAEAIPLDIVFEDEEILVLNKAAGMVVHRGLGHYQHSLLNALAHHYASGKQRQVLENGLVQRLDKDTSGLMVVAKTQAAREYLSPLFSQKKVNRVYQALVWGHPTPDSGLLRNKMGRNPMQPNSIEVSADGSFGKEAITYYHTLEKFTHCSWVSCRLETGRTHQVRIHMASIGHPVLFDLRYSPASLLKKYMQISPPLPRQALVATELGFTHPNGKEMSWTYSAEQYFRTLVQVLDQSI